MSPIWKSKKKKTKEDTTKKLDKLDKKMSDMDKKLDEILKKGGCKIRCT